MSESVAGVEQSAQRTGILHMMYTLPVNLLESLLESETNMRLFLAKHLTVELASRVAFAISDGRFYTVRVFPISDSTPDSGDAAQAVLTGILEFRQAAVVLLNLYEEAELGECVDIGGFPPKFIEVVQRYFDTGGFQHKADGAPIFCAQMLHMGVAEEHYFLPVLDVSLGGPLVFLKRIERDGRIASGELKPYSLENVPPQAQFRKLRRRRK